MLAAASDATTPATIPPAHSEERVKGAEDAQTSFSGCYRQNGSVLYVSECSSEEESATDSESLIDRLALVKPEWTREWLVLPAANTASFVGDDPDPHYFCVGCRSRFLNGTSLKEHLEQRHSVGVVEIPADQTTLIMSDLSVRLAQPYPSSSSTSSEDPLAAYGRNILFNQEATRFLQQMQMNLDSYGLINGNDIASSLLQQPTVSSSPQAITARNSTKTLKCPKCNWHYKYQETLEIHMKEKHSDSEVTCTYCLQNRAHPKLARGESYSCGYKPYRCELCKYSTTTKGNLSIHMQSDKHLHAMQEMPRAMVSPSPLPTTAQDADRPLQCLICGSFSTDSVSDMVDHLEIDRSRPCIGDITVVHGVYQCHLCPYSTNLKANFQLHTRTDKHVQRVHIMNHMREGGNSAGLGPATAVCRLSAVKSVVQVRCRPCQEILSCSSALREHCDSRGHQSRLAYLGVSCSTASSSSSLLQMPMEDSRDSPQPSPPSTVFECRVCPFTTARKPEAMEHMLRHEEDATVRSENEEPDFDDASRALVEMQEAAFCCAKCEFHCENREALDKHHKTSHQEEAASPKPEDASTTHEDAQRQCPLCPEKSTSLREHLVEEHKIADEAIERLMLASDKSVASSEMTATETAAAFLERHLYRFRCQQCPLAFKSEDSFLEHKLGHMFRAKTRNGADEGSEASVVRCEICQEGFVDRNGLLVHYNSVGHLKKAKKFLEQQPNSLQLSPQVLAALQQPSPTQTTAPSPSSTPQKPFKCNVCRLGYGQGSTLDIHLRSVAHQARMGRVAELVAAGEIDPQKPFSEQPGGPPQKLIGDLIAKSGDDDKALASSMDKQQQQSALTMLNMFNMAQLFSNMQQQQSAAQLNAFGQLCNGSAPFDFSSLLGTAASQSQNPPSSNGSGEATPAPQNDEELKTPKTGVALRKMLERVGLELEEATKKKVERLAEEAVLEMAPAECRQCQTAFPSLLALKGHCEEAHQAAVPSEVVEEFSERLRKSLDEIEDRESSQDNDDSCEPPEPKRMREIKTEVKTEVRSERSSASSSPTPPSKPANGSQPDLSNQLAMMGMMGFPFLNNPFMPMMSPDFFQSIASGSSSAMSAQGNGSASGSSPAKRARTRITDEQLKVLRQYFDINNSPSEIQIKEMSLKAGLPEKVIKHWFRNTLFKERQRDKDSPYNFSIPPQVSIDLDTYEKTGEAKITPLKTESSEKSSATPSKTPSVAAPATPQDLLNTLNKAGLGSLANFTLPTVTVPSTVTAAAQQNPFTVFMNNNEEKPPMPAMSASGSVTGRRANRTRFTDFQLRTLQQFFDKQAYPKDDDLEMLSRRLQLSPRVIVVWFQNARQKARKIYENQPNQENNERFLKTPGCNFQCKRCQVVFQRYYELIQHQQKLCYKDDTVAQQKDNRGVEEALSDDEKSSSGAPAEPTPQPTTATATANVNLDLQGTLAQLMSGITAAAGASSDPRTEELMKLIAGTSGKEEEGPKPNGGALDLSSSGAERESLSMSPSMNSDNDDGGSIGDGVDLLSRLNDSTSPVGMFASSSSAAQAQRSPATNSKRYRTHLTPTQVHVMKSLFADYKTPSMTECDLLGQEIGLHKRVVQVWFQNARAKERKARASNGEEELLRSSSAQCSLCGVEYSGGLSLQDHIFTHEHIQRVKDAGNPRAASSAPSMPSASTSALLDDVEGRRKPVRDRKGPVKTPSTSTAALNQFPYNLVYGMQSGQLPMIFDPNIMGTPVTMLQIPESVMSRITEDLQAGLPHTVFTQDGKQFVELETAVEAADFASAQAVDIDVGWACPQCSNVFQSEALLKNHQRMICQQNDAVFKLVQTHYECRPCAQKFGTQEEFKLHCATSTHKTAR
ncbi:hypothetical protein QR680_008814 [Steinernema hermaphroditum]|uniref:Homeobox domain-containing protein n=1 Tax=Steinernema hermaphroditum TaxID=289476 RepID=A0AA39M7Q8_9BILA|nr:hypothetical protein QR680_008814 [Steinernema hermaphroditum]